MKSIVIITIVVLSMLTSACASVAPGNSGRFGARYSKCVRDAQRNPDIGGTLTRVIDARERCESERQ